MRLGIRGMRSEIGGMGWERGNGNKWDGMGLGISRMLWDWKSVGCGIGNYGKGWDWESVICESLISDPIYLSDW